jgi:hypothetical protein
MALQDDLKSSLTGDTALMALLTGGVYADTRISRQTTAAAFDTNSEIKPCGLLRVTTSMPELPHAGARQSFATVYLYQRVGYDSIRSAAARLMALWHEQKIGSSMWEMLGVGVTDNVEDDALKCSLIMAQFQIYHR